MDQFDEVVQTILSEWKVLYPSIKDCSIFPNGFLSPSTQYVHVSWKEPLASRIPKEFRDLAKVCRKHTWGIVEYMQYDQRLNGTSVWRVKDGEYECDFVFTYGVESG